MQVILWGNQDIPFDNLPFRLLPDLQSAHPEIDFSSFDPNDDWFFVDDDIVIIDTVINITAPTIFDSVDIFTASPRISVHDFDALTYLRWLKKLGKINGKITILGLPPTICELTALSWLVQQLNQLQASQLTFKK